MLGGQRKGKLHDTDTIIVHLQVVLLVNGHVIFLVDGHMIRNFFGYLLREELPSVNVNNKISMTGFFPKLTKFISQPSPVLDKQRSSFASQLIDPISIFTSTRYLRLAFPLIKTNLKKNQFTYDGISAGRAATQTTANVKTIYKTYVKKTTKTQSNSEINNGNSIIQLTVLIIVMVDH